MLESLQGPVSERTVPADRMENPPQETQAGAASPPREVSFLVHSEAPADAGAILAAKRAFAEAGFAKDCHYLFHGRLVPIESLMVEHCIRAFSASVPLDAAALRKLARTFAWYSWVCIIPLRAVSRRLLEELAAAGPGAWTPPAGVVVYNRLVEWRNPPSTAAADIGPQEDPMTSGNPTPAASAAAPRISVIIPTYNRIDILQRTLQAYADQSLRKDQFEVLVVDDGSTDATWETLVRLAGEVPYDLRNFRQVNKGPGQARNLAVAEARGELLFITGDDILPDSDLLWRHLKAHAENPAEEVAVLGKVDWAKDLVLNTLMHYVTEKSSLQFGYTDLDKGKVPDYRYFYTSNISLKAAFLKGKTLFRPEFVHAAYEDIELGYRLSKDGMRIVYDRDSVGFHHHPMSVASFGKRQYKSGLMARIFARMHPEMAKEVGLVDAVRMGQTPESIRGMIAKVEELGRQMPFGTYQDHPYDRVPANEAAALEEYAKFITGAYYTLGLVDGLAEDAEAGLTLPEANLATPPVATSPAAAGSVRPGDPAPAPAGREIAEALNAEGEALFGEGREDLAVIRFCEALDADESFASAWNNLGVAAWQKGWADDARRLFNFALARDPGYAPAIENRQALSSHPVVRAT